MNESTKRLTKSGRKRRKRAHLLELLHSGSIIWQVVLLDLLYNVIWFGLEESFVAERFRTSQPAVVRSEGNVEDSRLPSEVSREEEER
jgi:hypothetical protein